VYVPMAVGLLEPCAVEAFQVPVTKARGWNGSGTAGVVWAGALSAKRSRAAARGFMGVMLAGFGGGNGWPR